MKIQLSEHFTYRKLLRFVFPSIIMMVFTSIYGVVDGLFVSNFLGKTPFAAINLIMPFLQALGALGFMLGTGGSALTAKTLGEGNAKDANRYFSMIVYTAIAVGIVISILSFLFIRPIASMMGAEGKLLEYSVTYARILIPFLTLFMLQNVFQSFFITAEKPHMGLFVIIAAGLTNIALDYLFIAIFDWGLKGAAYATVLGQAVGGFIPILYFSRKNSSHLKLTKTRPEKHVLIRSCTNGSSELMTNLSASLVNMLYNFQLMRIAGENGIAAYGAIMYVNFIFIAIFIGYSIGSAPIVGYHYGASNHEELKNLLRKSLVIVGTIEVILTISAELLATPMANLFVSYDQELYTMTRSGFRLYTLSYLICGFNIFSSAFFTALNNGLVSATISFLRTLVFQIVCVLILPIFLGINGIWLSVTLAEAMAILVTISFFLGNRKRYHYF